LRLVDRPNPTSDLGISQLPTHTATQIVIGDDKWTVSNRGGYAMARTTHGIDRGGKWYFEVRINQAPGNVRFLSSLKFLMINC
jgi:hypothetical protein